MPWGAAATVAGAAISANAAKKKGAAGTSTASKDPWGGVEPWLKNLSQQGSDLSYGYSVDPYSAAQKQSYLNSAGLSDYAQTLVPSLLGQLSSNPIGYDPANPSAKPAAYDFTQGIDLLGGGGTMSNLLAQQFAASDAGRDSRIARAAEVNQRNNGSL